MAPLATVSPPHGLLSIPLLKLTPSTFAPFGTVIQNPQSTSSSSTVNQGTAQKYLRISPLTDAYPSGSAPSSTNINLFVCSPRELTADRKFLCRVLERHPYTTQTFIPLGLSPGDKSTRYIVIVAPSEKTGLRLPWLNGLTAFLCDGGQAVTYAAGTWHAPMVVVGERRIEFLVLINENGVEDMDTQEVSVDPPVAVRVLQGRGLWKERERRERRRESKL